VTQSEFLQQLKALQQRFNQGLILTEAEKLILLAGMLLGQETRQEQKYDLA